MKTVRGHNVCEICGEQDRSTLDRHHIIPRTDPMCTNWPDNLALICSNCHRRVHAGEIIIEGVFMTSLGLRLITHAKGEPFLVRPGIILRPDGLAEIVEEADGRKDFGRVTED